jgi:hypothetical protein
LEQIKLKGELSLQRKADQRTQKKTINFIRKEIIIRTVRRRGDIRYEENDLIGRYLKVKTLVKIGIGTCKSKSEILI